MTTEAPVRKTYSTTITGIETVDKEGRQRDRPVLATAVIPVHSKQYGMRLSVDVEQVKGFKAGDQVTLTVERGGERKSPPKWPSDWFWNLQSLTKGHAAPPADGTSQNDSDRQVLGNASQTQTGGPPPQYRADPIQERIQLGMAINGAINLAAGAVIPTDIAAILEWRDKLYWGVVLPPVRPLAKMALDDATQPAEAPEAPEPTQTPAAEQRASYEALSRLNGARQAALNRHEWATEQGSLAALEGFVKRNFQDRAVRQLSDAEVDMVTAAVREGKL